MMNENEDKVVMRANLVRYFTLGNLATIGMVLLFGQVPVSNLSTYALISAPAVVLAWWLGDKVFRRLNPILFRRVAMVIISLSAVMTLGSGLAP